MDHYTDEQVRRLMRAIMPMDAAVRHRKARERRWVEDRSRQLREGKGPLYDRLMEVFEKCCQEIDSEKSAQEPT